MAIGFVSGIFIVLGGLAMVITSIISIPYCINYLNQRRQQLQQQQQQQQHATTNNHN